MGGGEPGWARSGSFTGQTIVFGVVFKGDPDSITKIFPGGDHGSTLSVDVEHLVGGVRSPAKVAGEGVGLVPSSGKGDNLVYSMVGG